ncbi:MAG: alanine dehydrogenase [Anaerolineae bacterium]|nr:alanine dehydrogenase [Anaerolineae bacterium]MDQ7036484.1 alanine dehydrogenase [Anaerolineae bacterium]
MKIGIPAEIKIDENRVSLPPNGVAELVKHGHTVYVQTGAGKGSSFSDEDYEAAGASIQVTAADTWNKADMVVKVKEPQASEYGFMREDLILFTYLHLAADEELTRAMIETRVTGVAYETVEDSEARLPLLEPMSEVAGRMASQVVAHYLEKHAGGRGVLMGGVPGVHPAHIVILGGGTVGTNAAKMALGMGARVTLLDINIERLRYLDDVMHGNFQTLYSNAANIAESIQTADAVIGGILITGARAPKLITREMLPMMLRGSVIVDVAVDQGGCVETTKATTHSDPTYFVDGVLHYGVANMPGAVPRTSSLALSNATLRYALRLADVGTDALLQDEGFLKGLNTFAGQITYPGVAEAFNLDYVSPLTALEKMREATT